MSTITELWGRQVSETNKMPRVRRDDERKILEKMRLLLSEQGFLGYAVVCRRKMFLCEHFSLTMSTSNTSVSVDSGGVCLQNTIK